MWDVFFLLRRLALNVLHRIENIRHAEAARRGGDELHQPEGTFGGDGMRIVVAFHLNDGMNQQRINAVRTGALIYQS